MNFKHVAALAALAMSSTVFAADLSADLDLAALDADTLTAAGATELQGATLSTTDYNLAIISQSGSVGHLAYISQTGDGMGNFALIVQSGDNNVGAAVISQVGTLNRAVIVQGD